MHVIGSKLAKVFLSQFMVTRIAIAGIGQGNGLGPSLWCLISTILIKMCKMKGHATKIITTIKKTVVSLIRFSFVDDADLVTAADNAHLCT